MRPRSAPYAVVPLAAVVSLLASLLVSVLVAAPAEAQRVRPTFWGMHDTDWRSAPQVSVGAANLTTSGTYWHQVEKVPLVYDLTRMKAQVSSARSTGAQPMLVLGGTPTFWSTDLTDPDRTDMPDLRAWRRYVRAVATELGRRVDYQIWPEPNVTQNWSGTPAQLARVTVAAAEVINDVAPGARVVGPAMTLRMEGQRRFMTQYYSQSVGGSRVHTRLDAIAVDSFPHQSGTPEDAWRLLLNAKRQLRRIGVRRPIWNNEINYGVAGGGDATTTRLPVRRQQAYVIRTYALSAAARVARTYWLGWFHTRTMAVNMLDEDGSRAAPARSYGVVRSWLAGSRFDGCRHRGGLWRCTAVKGQERRKLVWRTDGRRTSVRAPRGAVRWENQNGRSRRIRGGARVRVDYRPVMIASRR